MDIRLSYLDHWNPYNMDTFSCRSVKQEAVSLGSVFSSLFSCPFTDSEMIIWSGGHIENTFKLVNLGALNFSLLDKLQISLYMDKIFCLEFQRYILYNVENLRALSFNTLRHDIMAAIFQTSFSHTYSWMKMYQFQLIFNCNLFLRV